MERTKNGINARKFLNRFLSYVILFFSIFALCYSIKQISDYIVVKNENTELEKTLSELRESNEKLETLNDKLKDKDYFSIYVKDKYQYSSNNDSITPIQ